MGKLKAISLLLKKLRSSKLAKTGCLADSLANAAILPRGCPLAAAAQNSKATATSDTHFVTSQPEHCIPRHSVK
jgi:hypothetical protein